MYRACLTYSQSYASICITFHLSDEVLPMDKKVITIRVTPEQHQQLMELAKARRWKLQTLMEVLIEKFIEQQKATPGK